MAAFEHTTPQWISRGQVKGNWQSAMNLKLLWVTLKGNLTLCSSSQDSQPGWQHVRGLEQLHLGKWAFPNYTESSRKHCDVKVQMCNDYFEFPLWTRYDIPMHPGSWIYIPDLMTPKYISLPDCSYECQTYTPSCLLTIATWMFNKHTFLTSQMGNKDRRWPSLAAGGSRLFRQRREERSTLGRANSVHKVREASRNMGCLWNFMVFNVTDNGVRMKDLWEMKLER